MAEERQGRKVTRWATRLGLGWLTAVAILIAVVFVTLATAPGQRLLFGWAVDVAEASTGWTVALDAPKLDGLGHLRVQRVTVGDDAGAFLTIDAIDFRWRPWSLLRRQLWIERLDVQRIDIARLPPTAETADDPAEPPVIKAPELPLALRIEDVRLGEISIGADVAGAPLALAAVFNVESQATGTVAAAFKVRELTRAATRIDGDATLATDGQLELVITAQDGPDGLLPIITGQPDFPPSTLHVAGNGPLRDWRLRLHANAGSVADVVGDLSVDLASLTRLRGNLQLTPKATFTDLAGFDWPHPVTVDIDLAQPSPAHIDIKNLTIASASSTVQVTGALVDGRQLETFQVTADVLGTDVAPLLNGAAGFQAGQLSAQVQGQLDRPQADLRLEVSAPALPGVLSLPSLTCETSTRYDRRWQTDGVCRFPRIDGVAPLPAILGTDAQVDLAIEIDDDFNRIDVQQLAYRSSTAELAVTAGLDDTLSADGPTGEGRIDIARFSLAWLQETTGLISDGVIAGEIGANLSPGLAIAGRADLAATGLRSDDAALAQALAGPIQAGSDFRVARDGPLHVERLSVSTPWATAEGSAVLDPAANEIASTLAISLPDVSALPYAADVVQRGNVEIDLRASGTLLDIDASVQARVRNVSGSGFDIDRMTLDIDAAHRADASTATIKADGVAMSQPASLRAEIALTERTRLAVDDLAAAFAGVGLAGQLTGDIDTRLFNGRLRIDAESLTDVARLAGQAADGTLRAEIDLAPRHQRQAATVSATVSNAALGQITAEELSVDGRVDDLFVTPRLDLQVVVDQLTATPVNLEAAELTAIGTAQALEVTAAASGRMQAPFTLDADAEINAGNDVGATLHSFSGTLAGAVYDLQAPMQVRVRNGELDIQDLALRLEDGVVRATTTVSPTMATGQVRIEELPIGPIAQLLASSDAQGTVGLSLDLDWSPTKQSMTAQLSGRELRMPDQDEDLPSGALDANATWDGRWITVTGNVSGLTDQPATLSARLPLLAGTPVPSLVVAEDEAISASLDWQGTVAPLLALAPVGEHQLDGSLSVSLQAKGTVAKPDLSGTIALQDGNYEHLLWGTLLQNFAVTASGGADGRLELNGAANDGDEGQLRLAGTAELQGDDGPAGEITVSLQQATMLRRDDLEVVLSADLAASGSLQSVELSGLTRVDRMEVIIPERLPMSAQALQVREINGPSTAAAPVEPKRPGPVTALDLTVEVPGRAFVRGRGLESEWAGELRITGTSRQPRIVGTLQIVKGTFTFAGRDFAIETGTLRFAGTDDPTPDIDILVRHARDGFRADIRLSGPASAPALVLSSSPALPDDEILSRVVFGKSVRQLSPLQALQLTQSIAQISGVVGGGPGVLDKARRAIGADVLSIEGGDSGPQVGVGKYVWDNVYVGVRQGASAGSSEVEAKVEVTPNITIETDIGQNAGGNIGVNWKYDY